MKTTDSKVAVGIERMTADKWDALMAGSEKQTPKQLIVAEFEGLSPQEFIICPVAEGRKQEDFVQDVSVFLNKKGYAKEKKQVRKHPSDATKIVVRRLA